MSQNGPVGNGPSAAEAAVHRNDDEASRQRSTAPHYNSFPNYRAIQHETPNDHETSTQKQAAAAAGSGGKPSARVLGPDLLRGLLMMFMAMDHLGIALRPWEHGLGRHAEKDGVPVKEWNRPAGYLVRSLTHLCAPGFTLLLGTGVVYLGHSRRRQQGWSAFRLLRYFALRAVALTVVMIVHSLVMTAGQLWFLNIVLFALAADYFLAGALWLAADETERWLARRLARALVDNKDDDDTACARDNDMDAEQPLLHAAEGRPPTRSSTSTSTEAKAASISWHVHNGLLVVLSIVTIFWNIWLSENYGECAATSSSAAAMSEGVAVTAPAGRTPGWDDRKMDEYWWLRLWFYETNAPGVLSAFPPLAWLSFAIVGVLYARVIISSERPRRGAAGPARILMLHLAAGLVLAVAFVLTRLLHVGNLSEHCLQTPENRQPPRVGGSSNQYLASPAAFFYTVKYPPDVAFWALTLAANFFLLAGLWRVPAAFARKWLAIVLDFGTASLFFYVVHMPVVFVTGWAACVLFGHEPGPGAPPSPGGGLVSDKVIDSVFGFFAVWALCLLIMWPLCRWYGLFKFGKPSDSLWRIL
ncbi:hypothetical protein ISF_04460 [Cordyceps fumosorosea ARSEF 2679]|uniref:Heparan-alpha-glucosaminide N-acetyltransferase catalytic domain-containing protein n=1 Tax=Cordyceps fumosorosea (strain ARSEF 2679) TaxID=1081104 RepID=A0A162MPV6_CORFA|nr:hypothetical protein ISF_04460 [Cordyceps fumosorosea ARSEF 2679]OAA65050.1 hypothetical protein ISF_04460 [Cordyceps fumosorosea ARSEF 2679]